MKNTENNNQFPHSSLLNGTLISRYKILERIGSGGMSTVYRAFDTKLEKIIALKFLSSTLHSNKEAKERFESEAKITSKLNHPNIVSLYDIDEVDNFFFIAMEYVDGKSLRELINEGVPPLEEVINIAKQIGQGLEAAHQKGIIHRDIKPDNILVNSEGRVKIADFGLAKLKGSSRATKDGVIAGTIKYMSPEQTRGEAVDQQSDLFSFGATLYEMISGRPPFTGELDAAIIYSIANEIHQPLNRLVQNIPAKLINIVNRMLEKKKENRYQSIAEVLIDLNDIKVNERSRYFRLNIQGRNLRLIVATMVSILIVAVIAMIYLTKNRESTYAVTVLPFENLTGESQKDSLCQDLGRNLWQKIKFNTRLNPHVFEYDPATACIFGIRGQLNRLANHYEINYQILRMSDSSFMKSGYFPIDDWSNLYPVLTRIVEGIKSYFGYNYSTDIGDPFSYGFIKELSLASPQPQNGAKSDNHLPKTYISARNDSLLVTDSNGAILYIHIMR